MRSVIITILHKISQTNEIKQNEMDKTYSNLRKVRIHNKISVGKVQDKRPHGRPSEDGRII